MTKILLLEDDSSLIDGLEYSLCKNGFRVETVRSVKEALDRLFQSIECQQPQDTASAGHDAQPPTPPTVSLTSRYDLLLLDVTLPDGTGFTVCERVRAQDRLIPIIFLTASDEEVNVIRGLDGGADDYITKPFKIGELCSRIRALLRRAHLPAPEASAPETATHEAPASNPDSAAAMIAAGGIVIDPVASRVTLHDSPLELTRAEYRLLHLLMRNAGRVVTRDMILDQLWDGAGDFVDDNTLSVYVRRLREKIERDPSHPQHLLTVRGFGYRFAP